MYRFTAALGLAVVVISPAATADLLPALERVAVDAGGPTVSVAAEGDLVAWVEGMTVRTGRLSPDGVVRPLGELRLQRRPVAVDLHGSTLVAVGDWRIWLVDVLDPTRPRLIGRSLAPGNRVGPVTAFDQWLAIRARDGVQTWEIVGTGEVRARAWIETDLPFVSAVGENGLIAVGRGSTIDLHDLTTYDGPIGTSPPVASLEVNGEVRALGVSGDRLVALLDDPPGFEVVDVSDPADPARLGQLELPWLYGTGLGDSFRFITPDLVLEAVSTIGRLFDLSKPEAPTATEVSLPASTRLISFTATGDRLVVANHDGLLVFSLAVPHEPDLLSELANSGAAESVAVAVRSDGIVVDVTRNGILRSRRATRDGDFAVVDQYATPSGSVEQLKVNERRALVTFTGSSQATVTAIRPNGTFASPTDLTPTGRCSWTGEAELVGDTAWIGGYSDSFWLGSWIACVEAVDLSDPATPHVRGIVRFTSAGGESRVGSITSGGADLVSVTVNSYESTEHWDPLFRDRLLHVVDARNLDHPRVVGELELDYSTHVVSPTDNGNFLLTWPQPALLHVDLTNPTTPFVESAVDTRWHLWDVTPRENLILGFARDPWLDRPLVVLDAVTQASEVVKMRPDIYRQVDQVDVSGEYVVLLDEQRVELLRFGPASPAPENPRPLRW